MNSNACRKNRIERFDVVRISVLRFRSELCSHCRASKKKRQKKDGNGRDNLERTPIERDLWVVSLTPLDPFMMRGTNIAVRPNNEQMNTISDQEFETFWPLAKFYHNRYTLDLQILYSCQYISHEHEYIFYFFIVRLWKLTEASRSSKAFVSGDWNGCHIEVTVNCQGFDRVNAIDLGFRRSYSISEKSRLSRSADKESKFIEL